MQRQLFTAYSTCVLILGALTPVALAQHKVDPRNTYERVLCIVPIVGTGTMADPRRPLYAPVPSQMRPGVRTGILAYHSEESDDPKFALVEFVAADRAALKNILADVTVKSFLKGRDKHEDAEVEFKKLKKGFDSQRFFVRVP